MTTTSREYVLSALRAEIGSRELEVPVLQKTIATLTLPDQGDWDAIANIERRIRILNIEIIKLKEAELVFLGAVGDPENGTDEEYKEWREPEHPR